MYFEYTQLTYSMLSERRQIGLVFYLISDYFNCKILTFKSRNHAKSANGICKCKYILLYDVIDQSVHFAIVTEPQGLVAVL